jgi:hypothetical protein
MLFRTATPGLRLRRLCFCIRLGEVNEHFAESYTAKYFLGWRVIA